MSAHHPRHFDPAQDTARLSMRVGVMASLWQQVPHITECNYPDPSLVGEVSDSTWGALEALVNEQESSS